MDQKYLDYFQLVCQVFFLYVFVGRTLYLRVHRKVRVFTLGVAKRGVQQEEKFLCLTYGQAYRDYCVQTGRYFGWRRDKAKNAHARRV
jgi:protein-S-isoprenylcysteine O-methyltransferase Ste14